MAHAKEALAGLMGRVALGDRGAFRSLYEKTAPDITGLLYGLLKHQDAVDDVLQDTYVKVWHRAADYHPGRGQVTTWIASIARYRAIDLLRMGQRRRGSEDGLLEIPDLDADVVEQFAAASDQQRLGVCMETLSSDQQQSIGLAFYRGYTHDELAEELDTPLGTVKAWVRRGLKKLRECLEQ